MSVASQWAAVLDRLSDATVASGIMQSKTADAKDRDLATDRYVTAVDALVAVLTDLDARGFLAEVSALVAARDAPRQGRVG